ncbi:DUF418 domain-containing protein [Tundrisphaera lichenicola]|uniref:DUF418 domain-containing protein n=1 Tax=Tundrisphaera lichenicola TaxID=2029860 RepID=UPI003EB963BF
MSIEEQPIAVERVEPVSIEEPIPVPKALPVEGRERVKSVDVIRGVALMGILAMNIVGFGWPMSVYSIPIMAPDHDWADMALWGFNHLIFDTKMMTLFSMLFGAGLVLMTDRAEARGARMRGVYYRRVFWLLVIGLIHSYLIWDGDVLVLYASCGLVLYPVRKWSAKRLIIVGTCLNLLLVPLLLGFRFGGVPFMRATAERVEAKQKAHQKPAWWEEKVHEGWKEMSKSEMPKREDFLKQIAIYRGHYWGMVKDRAQSLIWGQTLGFVFGGWFFAGGRMLIGMGLMKLGVFSAERSRRAYLTMMVVGYGIGLPLMAFDAIHEASNGFFLGRQLWHALDGWPLLTIYGSLPVVFGHIGLVMLICQAGALPWLTRRLAAAGRMALSCYLFDSIACTTLFYGYGFDLFGTLHRPLLYAVVLIIWTAQLLVCPLWLEWFRFGPAEWLWRSLTYWKPQPMRIRVA